ncbi:MAG TPA: BREX-2 system adenine-specific DNA-methyltransferase PglX [Pirellulaceae bacterium]|nr:BREX-2 system adenine-specific DNA-methyltransferase PglX [Pirellulaceae bacterium]
MIDRKLLLADLRRTLELIERDLLERSESTEVPEVGATLRREYERARAALRTAQNFVDWRRDAVTQQAAAWVLSAVFVRFLEDNRLIDPPRLAGPTDDHSRLQRARDEQELYFRAHPRQTDRDYLLAIFDELARLPPTAELFGPFNPLRELPNWLSGDAAGELIRFFRKVDSDTGRLVHDFTDPEWDTRFLGDLYQDLSEAARKKYALLQTPEFVEAFILDRTLEPALDEFGLAGGGPVEPGREPTFRMIDPACGSGHFLLGAFRRLLERHRRADPQAKPRLLVQRALDAIHGIDVNPYAIAIARFRLLLAAMSAGEDRRLIDAPGYRLNLVCGDSLLVAPLVSGRERQGALDFEMTDDDGASHAYASENLAELKRLAAAGRYDCVVANPPYITPKDKQLNEQYRKRFATCHMKYSLAIPFFEQLFRLARGGERAGFVSQLTTNSFMKREFGKKLVETWLPTIDLTHVIDVSGAYIPGNGTPSVILFGRARAPLASTLRTVLGIRGEPSTPDDPGQGLVWQAILAQVDHPGSHSAYVSAGDSPRELFEKHPWSIGGGGASELKEELEERAKSRLESQVEVIGIVGMSNADELMLAPRQAFMRRSVEDSVVRRLAMGDEVRDWMISDGEWALFPYANEQLVGLNEVPGFMRWTWPCRTVLGNRATFGGGTYLSEGRPWWEWHQITLSRLRTPLSIVFAEVATHNHFVLDRGGKVFNRTAPVIKLPAEATEADHLALLGLLNSSTACFWMKQVCFAKGGFADGKWEERHAFGATAVGQLPIAKSPVCDSICQLLAKQMIVCASRQSDRLPGLNGIFDPSSQLVCDARVSLQEELDWHVYRAYELIDERTAAEVTCAGDPPPIRLGQRAFEIVLARRLASGDETTTWFERHGSTPIVELPDDWPADYRRIVERRIELIESDPNLGLIERPEYKRRWNVEPWESRVERAVRAALLDRLEACFDLDGRMRGEGEPIERPAFPEPRLVSLAQLADVAARDPRFLQLGELRTGDRAFDVLALVTELVLGESVPHLPVLRYKPSGLAKRAEWERTWELQREEDRTGRPIDGGIPVPPKYASSDFPKSDWWRLRGKLDVPKERWLTFPGCESSDGTLPIAWAGYDALQLAQAIAAQYVDIQERQGGRDDGRLIPLLASLIELLPWLKQWHDDPDPRFDGLRMGTYYEGFVTEEARSLGLSPTQVKAWTPPKTTTRGRKKKE